MIHTWRTSLSFMNTSLKYSLAEVSTGDPKSKGHIIALKVRKVREISPVWILRTLRITGKEEVSCMWEACLHIVVLSWNLVKYIKELTNTQVKFYKIFVNWNININKSMEIHKVKDLISAESTKPPQVPQTVQLFWTKLLNLAPSSFRGIP